MARLTRTQKYAELRDQISHDREESIESQQLQQYEDKLNNITGLGNNDQQKQQATNVSATVNTNEPLLNNSASLPNNNVNQNIQNNPSFNTPQVDPRQMLNNRIQNLEGAVNPNQFYPNNPQMPGNFRNNSQMRNNDFINNTFQEVNSYNRQNGNAMLDDLSNQLMYDIRNQDGQRMMNPQMYNNGMMNQGTPYGYSNMQAPFQAQQAVDSPFIDETSEMNNANTIYSSNPERYNQQMPYSNNIPMGIKNVNDMSGYKVQHDFVDDTMPFNINKTKREEKDLDYEEEVPNKALNVILGILIFVLVVVLGIIIYYILVAKGLIG